MMQHLYNSFPVQYIFLTLKFRSTQETCSQETSNMKLTLKKFLLHSMVF